MSSAVTGRMLTGVSSHFSAAHYAPPLAGSKETQGALHGHTWLVTAWFTNDHKADARLFKVMLDAVLKLWDHTTLPDDLAWGEDIARAVGTLNNCVQVDVSRPLEGYHAKWIAASVDTRRMAETGTGSGPQGPGSAVPLAADAQPSEEQS